MSTLVQHGTSATSATAFASTTAGNLLVVLCRASNGAAAFSAPAGWLAAGAAVDGGVNVGQKIQLFYYPNNPGGITAATFTNSANTMFAEFNTTRQTIDQYGTNTVTVSTPLAGTVTTAGNLAQSAELAIAGFAASTSVTHTHDASFADVDVNNVARYLEWGDVGTAGLTQTATETVSATRTYVAFVATFKVGTTINNVTASDTIGALSDTATRTAQAFTRTASDTISALSDSATRTARALTRTGSDALGALADVATRAAQSFTRTTSDSPAAPSDSVARSQVTTRTGSDVLGAITDAVTRAARSLTRSASDSPPTPTDSTTRSLVLGRSSSDVIPGVVDSVTRAAQSFLRGITDTVAAIVDVALRIVAAPGRGKVVLGDRGARVDLADHRALDSVTLGESVSSVTVQDRGTMGSVSLSDRASGSATVSDQ